MQPNRRAWRSWNWRRLARKARGGAVAALVSLPILVFVGLIYIARVFGRFFRQPRQGRAAPLRLIRDGTPASAPGGVPPNRGQSVVHEPGSRPAQRPASEVPSDNAPEERYATEGAPHLQSSDSDVDGATVQGLALCATPAAILVIVEELALCQQLRWQLVEAVFSRLIDLGATANDVRAVTQVLGYEWLYEMQISPRRFIRLKPLPDAGFRWQHYATRLICFEFEGGRERDQVLPPLDVQFSQSRLFFFFASDDQLLGWERPREPRRRYL